MYEALCGEDRSLELVGDVGDKFAAEVLQLDELIDFLLLDRKSVV